MQKAGTSWWFDLIKRHPEVYHRPYVEVDKERHFFSHYGVTQFTEEDAVVYAIAAPAFPERSQANGLRTISITRGHLKC